MFKLRLRLPGFLAFFIVLALSAAVFAQEPTSVPETPAQEMPSPEPAEPPALPAAVPERPPVFVELFSSQACVFCPQADRMFSDLVRQKNVMGIACHVDYFDVKEGALSHPFCTDRQSWYMKVLKAGPNYTPQMVINGHYDVVGHLLDDVTEGLAKAAQDKVVVFDVNRKNDKNIFEFVLPALSGEEERHLKLWLAVYDNYESLTIKEGRNRGKVGDYTHIVRDLQDIGTWDGTEVIRIISPDLKKDDAGFYVLAQDPETGVIVAVGQFSNPV